MRFHSPPPYKTEGLHRIRKKAKNRVERRNTITRPLKEVVCPFDPYHVIDESYLNRHMVNCASSANGKNNLCNVKRKSIGVVPLEASVKLTVPVMKDWDTEEVLTYDPYINTQDKKVIRYLILVPKSQKKAFKQSERLRIQLLEQAEANGSHKEICQMIRNLSQDALWEVILEYMKRLDITSIETVIDNLDLNNMTLSKPGATQIKGREDEENIISIDIAKLTISDTCVTRNQKNVEINTSDIILSNQLQDLVIDISD